MWGTTVYVFKPTVQSRLVTRRTSSYITSDYYLVSLVLYLKTDSWSLTKSSPHNDPESKKEGQQKVDFVIFTECFPEK